MLVSGVVSPNGNIIPEVIATAGRAAPQRNLSADVVTAILTKPYDIETFMTAVRSCIPEVV